MASTAITRRRLIALLGAGLAAGAAGRSAAAGGAVPLSLPQRPQRLERVLSHVVGGQTALSVRRGWEVWFAPQGRGIAVSGRQLFAEVNAPPQLAALARIEQQRTETGLFPLMLDADGAILPVADAQGVSAAVTAALGAAEELIARGPGRPISGSSSAPISPGSMPSGPICSNSCRAICSFPPGPRVWCARRSPCPTG